MNRFYSEKLSQIKSDTDQLTAFLTKKSTVVLAGPGSGKTTVLTMKLISLMQHDIQPPQGLACLTYSNEAAREIRVRLQRMGVHIRHNVYVGTVHSFCIAEILSPFGKLSRKIAIPFPIKIASGKLKMETYKSALKKNGLSDTDVSISDMDRERKLGVGGISKVQVPYFDTASRVAIAYEEELHTSGHIDFEDIINFSTSLIQDDPYIRRCIESKFPWLLIDEYQDLGKPLHEMVLSLILSTRMEIFAVGDPDQSIYGFQGAVPEFLSELSTFTNMETVQLKTNYRSTQDIIGASEAILQIRRGYRARIGLQENAEIVFFVCEREMMQQYQLVADKIVPHYQRMGIPLNEIAILVGKNTEAKELCEVLESRGVRTYIAKHDFERTDFVRWIEDCAAWTSDMHLIAFNDIADFWSEFVREHGRATSDDPLMIRMTLYSILEANKKNCGDVVKWLDFLLAELNVISLLQDSERYPDENENLTKLRKTIIGEFRYQNLSSLAALGRPVDQVTVSTRHSSKGLEFDVVVLLGMEEERFPDFYSLKSAAKLEECNRVCFVCVSRARRVCILVRSKVHTINTHRGPWEKPYGPSRYWVTLKQWEKE